MKQYSRVIIFGAIILVIGAIVLISNGIRSIADSTPNSVSLKGYAVNVASVRLASTKNHLDGSGEFSNEDCNKLGELAKQYDSTADYIDCSSPSALFLDTPDTANSYVLTISDDDYTAIFTTDKDLTTLLNYGFLKETSGGFNTYEGRR